MATLAFWILFLSFLGVFAAQVARRVQVIAAAPNTFSLDDIGFRSGRFLVDVVLQWRTIKERPLTGLMHAFVFWGFVAFGGYTLTEFLYGLGLVGQLCASIAKAAGCVVVGIDINPKANELATAAGATLVVNPSEPGWKRRIQGAHTGIGHVAHVGPVVPGAAQQRNRRSIDRRAQ